MPASMSASSNALRSATENAFASPVVPRIANPLQPLSSNVRYKHLYLGTNPPLKALQRPKKRHVFSEGTRTGSSPLETLPQPVFNLALRKGSLINASVVAPMSKCVKYFLFHSKRFIDRKTSALNKAIISLICCLAEALVQWSKKC